MDECIKYDQKKEKILKHRKLKNFGWVLLGIMLVSISYSSQITDLNGKYINLENENKELKIRLDAAAPYFKLQEQEKELQRIKLEEETKRLADEKAKQEAETKRIELESKKIILGSGNYVSGKNFAVGKYTITAIDGGGNVSSSNMFSGGINAVMGVENNGFYEKEYKNISLPKDVTLTISRVTVQLVPVE